MDRRDGRHRTSYPEPCPEDPNQRLAINARPPEHAGVGGIDLPTTVPIRFRAEFGHSLGTSHFRGGMARSIGGGAGSLQWSVMTDAFGTMVDYPAAIFTAEKGTPPRGIGRVMESADGEARLMVYVEGNDAHRERTEEEYQRLLQGGGFWLDRVIPTHSPFSVIEATRT
jgi:hypothetical protein